MKMFKQHEEMHKKEGRREFETRNEPNQPNSRVYPTNPYVADRPCIFIMQRKQIRFNLPGSSPRTVLRLQGGKGVVQHPRPLLSSRQNETRNLEEVLTQNCREAT